MTILAPYPNTKCFHRRDLYTGPQPGGRHPILSGSAQRYPTRKQLTFAQFMDRKQQFTLVCPLGDGQQMSLGVKVKHPFPRVDWITVNDEAKAFEPGSRPRELWLFGGGGKTNVFATKKLPTKDANGSVKGSLNETGSAHLGIPFFLETSPISSDLDGSITIPRLCVSTDLKVCQTYSTGIPCRPPYKVKRFHDL